MAYYLLMDGVDDYFRTNGKVLHDEVIMVMSATPAAWRTYVAPSDATGYSFVRNGSGGEAHGASTTVYKNGVLQVSNTTYVTDVKATYRIVYTAPTNNSVYFFANTLGTPSTTVKGFLWEVKLLNQGVLMAHYDFTLGHGLDQSGKNNQMTLFGGTWINDAPADPGIDVSYTYATKQAVIANRSGQMATTQKLYENKQQGNATRQTVYTSRTTAAATKQIAYANRSAELAMMQAVYGLRSTSYAMLQSLFSDYIAFTASYPIRVNISAQRLIQHSIKAVITKQEQASFALLHRQYAERSSVQSMWQVIRKDVVTDIAINQVISGGRTYAYAVLIKIFDADKKIVSKVRLIASRVMKVQLRASVQNIVQLRGEVK